MLGTPKRLDAAQQDMSFIESKITIAPGVAFMFNQVGLGSGGAGWRLQGQAVLAARESRAWGGQRHHTRGQGAGGWRLFAFGKGAIRTHLPRGLCNRRRHVLVLCPD